MNVKDAVDERKQSEMLDKHCEETNAVIESVIQWDIILSFAFELPMFFT